MTGETPEQLECRANDAPPRWAAGGELEELYWEYGDDKPREDDEVDV